MVSYTYDSWGKPFVTDTENIDVNDTVKDGITGSLASTVGTKNPYRYREYRYDTEARLYYLQSRYYNPELGRFINADGIVGVIGELLTTHNMFMYCNNNPVNMIDQDGRFAILIPIIWVIAEVMAVMAPVVVFVLTQAPAISQAATYATANANQIIAAADTVKNKVWC